MKLTPEEINELRYAARNHGRTFRASHPECHTNPIVDRLTDAGLLIDGGPSTFGRWRELTALGRAALADGD